MRGYLEDLNQAQREAVLHYGSPLLILAGAGSGKTRVITVKIAYLIEELGIGPREILAVTFTNKAAGEMRERARALAPEAAETLIRTFHSFGAWVLRRNAAAAGLTSRFTIYDDEDMVSLLKTLYPTEERRRLGLYAAWISRAKDYCLGPSDNLSPITQDHRFPELYAAYEKKLREIGNADFGDLILRPVEMFRDHPEVLKRFHERFRVLLVDEYQDSNMAQYELLKVLAGPESFVCVVGDDDQSIYRFRGAEVRNILTFPESFPGTKIIRLEQNYRSTGAILEAASAVVANNKGRLGKTLWTSNGEGQPPTVTSCEDQDEEARYCLSLIRKNPGLETAILYRTNAQSRGFETLFLREGIPYTIIGTLRFYEREEVKDTLAFLKFLLNPRDELSFRRIVNKPARGIGEVTVDKILALGGPTVLDALEKSSTVLKGRAGTSLREFRDLVTALLDQLEREPLAEFTARLIRETGLADLHKAQDEVAGTQKLKNLEELVNAASLYGRGAEALAEFLEGIELDRSRMEGSAQEGGPTGVVLITMHNTKGLEFDRVVITGMEEGLFPRGGEETEEDLEEERRLFYVAITRARKELHFTTCRTRRHLGRSQFYEPSRFLYELPQAHAAAGQAETGLPGGWKAGMAVYHESYGTGVVSKAWYADGLPMVLVSFQNGRTMQFYPKYESRLERIEIDGL